MSPPVVADSAVSAPPQPSAEVMSRAVQALAPIRRLIMPKVFGIDGVPARRALFVGNHTLMGVLDVPLILAELWERGVSVRALGDHAHFKVPVWREMMLAVGVVDGTPAITESLMANGENILVFPGGGREVAKLKGEKYRLIWKNRMGFARLALKHGYPIVPFASVGAEESLDIVLDNDSPLMGPVRFAFEKLVGSSDLVPVVRGIGMSPIPRPARQYYWFGEAIETRGGVTGEPDEREVRRVREQVRREIEAGIEFLRHEQAADPRASLLSRLVGTDTS